VSCKATANTTRKRPERPTALDRAEHGSLPVKLTHEERAVLEVGVRLGQDLADEMQSKVMAYGRWVLEAVFHNDSSAALDVRSKNPVWLELVRRAGGPTLKLSRRLLYVCVKLAAYDKRITDQSWRALDAGRKELLLPLGEEDRLREAAQVVAKFKLSQGKTKAYVTQLLSRDGKARQVRITAAVLANRVRKLRESLGRSDVLRRVRELREQTDAADRARVVEELDKLRDVLSALSGALRGR
jgi:hypothetical protein